MKHTGRELVNSRDMTRAEEDAMMEIRELMGIVNTETFSKEAEDAFVKEVVGSGIAMVMQARYILTAEESATLIAALRKLTGRKLS